MDVAIFIKSLSGPELQTLRNHLLNTFEVTPIALFLKNNEMSIRLRNVLTENIDTFEYISEINKYTFLKLPNAGQRSWKELEELLKKYK